MTKGYKCDRCGGFFEGEVFFIAGINMPYRGLADTIISTAAYRIELCQNCAAAKFDDLILPRREKK